MFDALPKPAPHDMPVRIEIETPADAAAVEALVLAAFGPGRFAKTAERLRERAGVAAAFVAREDGKVIGSVRLWRIAVGESACNAKSSIGATSCSSPGAMQTRFGNTRM